MRTSVTAVEVLDRGGENGETRMLPIRTPEGELMSHRLWSLLQHKELRAYPRRLIWELAEDVRSLASRCAEPSFPEPELAGELAYLADHPDAMVGFGVLKRLLRRRSALKQKLRQMEASAPHRQNRWLWED